MASHLRMKALTFLETKFIPFETPSFWLALNPGTHIILQVPSSTFHYMLIAFLSDVGAFK